jgi:hypothetical protein
LKQPYCFPIALTIDEVLKRIGEAKLARIRRRIPVIAAEPADPITLRASIEIAAWYLTGHTTMRLSAPSFTGAKRNS